MLKDAFFIDKQNKSPSSHYYNEMIVSLGIVCSQNRIYFDVISI